MFIQFYEVLALLEVIEVIDDGSCSLFPTCKVFLYLGQPAAVERRLFDSASFLSPVVFKQDKGIFPKSRYRHKVACREHSHKQVANTPHDVKACQSSQHNDHSARQQPVYGQYRLA